jgi:hypothetical protein
MHDAPGRCASKSACEPLGHSTHTHLAIVPGVLLLITGASGAGKSTVRAAVEPELSPGVECAELLDLTPPPITMTRAWRQQTAEIAVRRAVELQACGRHLLLSGDPVPAAEIAAAPSATGLEAIAVCLLDLTPEVQAERLRGRGEHPALLPDHQAFDEWWHTRCCGKHLDTPRQPHRSGRHRGRPLAAATAAQCSGSVELRVA